jgi:hypothetical protein
MKHLVRQNQRRASYGAPGDANPYGVVTHGYTPDTYISTNGHFGAPNMPNSNQTFYNLPGNAGMPGCGTGTAIASECGLQVLPVRSAAVAAGAQATIGISALRAGAFKARKWFVFGIGDGAANSGTNVRFELEAVTVQGIPQFISTVQDVANGFVALSDSFLKPDEPVPVSFMVFGSDAGQQMQVTVRNIGAIAARCYITLWGDAAEVSAIGTR